MTIETITVAMNDKVLDAVRGGFGMGGGMFPSSRTKRDIDRVVHLIFDKPFDESRLYGPDEALKVVCKDLVGKLFS